VVIAYNSILVSMLLNRYVDGQQKLRAEENLPGKGIAPILTYMYANGSILATPRMAIFDYPRKKVK